MATTPSASNAEPSSSTTVDKVRKADGKHFAAGYGDQDTLGEVLCLAGVSALQGYLAQEKHL